MFGTIRRLQELHKEIGLEIIDRLNEFQNNNTIEKISKELFFCLLTPQSKARVCWENVERLYSDGVLLNKKKEEISEELKGVRFKNNKARYIVEARGKILNKNSTFCNFLSTQNDFFLLREYIAEDIKGMGYKEASHFLRNIGKGSEFAILDRHILRGLERVEVIKEIPKNISKRKYLEIEQKMKNFACNEIKIPISHLDFVFWYFYNGEIFK